MWTIRNRTPYAADRTWIRDKDGRHHWIVALKATFDLSSSGSVTLADEQQPPLLASEYTGVPGESSILWESDLAPAKPTTDVLVHASAYAPRGRPMPRVQVAIKVADVHKELVVFGERVYRRRLRGGLKTSGPRPFRSKPIRYEEAYGGTDTSHPSPRKQRFDARNPVGRGVARRRSQLLSKLAHSVEYPRGRPDRTGPAGLGPIASHWSPRRELAGTYGSDWERTKRPLLPDDYDDAFTLCSPQDQRPKRHLRGGERVELINLSPEGTLSFTLPRMYPTFSTSFGTRREEHRAHLATVAMDLEARLIYMTWLTSLAVGARDADYLDETIVDQKPYVS